MITVKKIYTLTYGRVENRMVRNLCMAFDIVLTLTLTIALINYFV